MNIVIMIDAPAAARVGVGQNRLCENLLEDDIYATLTATVTRDWLSSNIDTLTHTYKTSTH